MSEFNCMTKVTGVFILLLLIIPFLAKDFTTQSEIKPIGGLKNLTVKGRFMHLLVHFSQFPMETIILLSIMLIISFYVSQIF